MNLIIIVNKFLFGSIRRSRITVLAAKIVLSTVSAASIFRILVLLRRYVKSLGPGQFWFNTRIGSWLYGLIMRFCARELAPDYRQLVKDTKPELKHSALRNHSHPIAATYRCRANTCMEHICLKLGRNAYHYQMSPTQQRLQALGHRDIRCAKDLQMRYQDDELSSDDVILLTDVDYYVHLPDLLHGNFVLAYSFVPGPVAGKTEDGVYTTHSDNTVEVISNGGARYRHELWDYDDDHIVVDTWSGSYVYLLEQIYVSETRRIIYFNPVRYVFSPMAWLLPGRRLQRRQLVFGDVAYSKYMRQDENTTVLMHSIAKLDTFDACTIKSDAFDATLIRLSENKTPHLADVERYFNTFKIDNVLHAASLFYHMFQHHHEALASVPRIQTDCVHQVDRSHYQAVNGLVSEDGKPTMRILWPGYLKGGFAPVKSHNNDASCLQGRITDVKNKRPSVPPVYYSYMSEFINHLVPKSKRNTLAPMSFDDWGQIASPKQRSLLERAVYSMYGNVSVSAFQKREAYGKITHPRNISTFSMSHNAVLGSFTKVFLTEIMKETHWYAFGKHPTVTLKDLHMKANGTSYANCSDFSKLDGSLRELFRDLMIAAMMLAFKKDYHSELLSQEKKERYAKGRTSHGIRYELDATIGSGSSDTSLLGTLTNAFIMYVAYRVGLSADCAWTKLGFYGGDDGVSFDLPANWVNSTASNFGMHVKSEITPAGLPIQFLGRNFPDIWTSEQSFADVQRQVKKLHLTTSPAIVPNWLALYRKAIGYRVTDTNTPFLTKWCDKVISLCESLNPEVHKYWQLTVPDSIYWAKFDGPFIPPTDDELSYSIVAKSLSVTVSELTEIETRISAATTFDELLTVDIFPDAIAEVGIDCVVNGECLTANVTKTHHAKVEQNSKLSVKPCWFVKKGLECKQGERCKYSHDLHPGRHTNSPKHGKLPEKILVGDLTIVPEQPRIEPTQQLLVPLDNVLQGVSKHLKKKNKSGETEKKKTPWKNKEKSKTKTTFHKKKVVIAAN